MKDMILDIIAFIFVVTPFLIMLGIAGWIFLSYPLIITIIVGSVVAAALFGWGLNRLDQIAARPGRR